MRKIFLLFALFWLPLHGQPPLAVYLTWQHDPLTTMTVQWVTDNSHLEDYLEVRPLSGGEWRRIEGTHEAMPQKHPERIHTVEITGLQPGTSYLFRVAKDYTEYRFRTIPDNPETPIRFVIGGDVYHDTLKIVEEMNVKAAATYPHFALIGGDISYAAHKTFWRAQNHKAWMDFLTAWSETMVTPDSYLIPIVPVVGNHDVTGRYGESRDDAPYYYALFATPQKKGYFVLDFGKRMSIFGLDSGHTNPIGGKQTEWLAKNIEERKEVPYKFAFYHVPAYPSVRPFTNKRCIPIRQNWVPLFEKYGLTAAFEHHEHAYKRSPPIYEGKVDAEKGVLYLGDGAWGVETPRTPKDPEDTWYLTKTASARHFILANLGSDGIAFSAIDAQGHIFDKTKIQAPKKAASSR